MNARYGIDAPGLVRAFLTAGLGLLVLSGLIRAIGTRLGWWAPWLAGGLLIPAFYALGMFALMLYDSLVTKIRTRDAVLDMVPWKGDERVLDVGCGRGLMLVGAARRLTTGQAVGVDIWLDRDQSGNSATAPVENARHEGVGGRVSVETADMRSLPFAGQSFDIVLSNWAVHNLEDKGDRAKALSEMARVLRPGGTILLTDIVNRQEYLDQLRHLGFPDAKLVVQSAARDWFLSAVSFGSYQPATVIAHRAAGLV